MSGIQIRMVYKLVQILLKKWDPDFSKLTMHEKRVLAKSEIELSQGKYISEEDIWGE